MNVFFDLDGTLLNDDGKITDHSKKVLKKMVDRGDKISILTGKPTAAALKYQKDFPFFTYICGYNGSQILKIEGEIQNEILNSPINNWKKLYERVIFILKNEENDYSCSFSDDDFTYIDRENEINTYIQSLTKLENKICDFKTLEAKPFTLRVMVCDKSKSKDLLDKLLESNLVDNYEISLSTGHFILLNEKGCDKGSSLEKLISKEGISSSNIVFYGDSGNDISVFNIFNNCIAMKNSTQEIKNVAKYVNWKTNNEGIIDYEEII